MNSKGKYISSAFLLLTTSIIVKIIGAFYKIPLTAYIGAVGRGYFADAYNLYLPLHAVIMGSLPIAMSRLTSKYSARGDLRMLFSLRRSARPVFILTGLAGTAVLLAAAKPYSEFIASSPKGIYTILVLAPDLLICCAASGLRGFYEGRLDMKPTAVSQVLEAFFKLIFGILFARACMLYMLKMYEKSGKIFGNAFFGEKEAMSFIYPFTSAAAMLGVTAGSLVSLMFVLIYDGINKPRLIKTDSPRGRKELLGFSFPIMLSCAVQSVFQFLDTSTIQLSLKRLPEKSLLSVWGKAVNMSQTARGDIVSYVWGLFCTALDFKNLVPGITMALGVSAVPAICREFEGKNFKRAGELVNSVYKYTSLLSVFLSLAVFIFADDILKFFYSSSSPDIASGCLDITRYLALSAPLYSLASIAVFCVQALGRPEKSVFPYVVSGVLRCALNLLLVGNEKFILNGAVISGAAGYFVLFLMNTAIVKRILKFRLSLLQVVIKPAVIGALTCFISRFAISNVNFSKNIFLKLLIEIFVFTLIYCMLCILTGELNLKELRRDLKFKNNGLNT